MKGNGLTKTYKSQSFNPITMPHSYIDQTIKTTFKFKSTKRPPCIRKSIIYEMDMKIFRVFQAVEYLKKRTPARAVIMIAAVWLMSALICIPPLLGWRAKRENEDFPKCKVRASWIFFYVHSGVGRSPEFAELDRFEFIWRSDFLEKVMEGWI